MKKRRASSRGKVGAATARLLVPRAGSPHANNLIRSLKAGDTSLTIVGIHDDSFVLRKSLADRNYLFSTFSLDSFRRALQRVIEAEAIDLIVPASYPDVKMISDFRDDLPCGVFMPAKEVVDLCRDKYELTVLLGRHGVPVAETYPLTRYGDIEKVFRRFGKSRPLWCRARNGAGSYGALAVDSAEQAGSWIRQWEEIRSLPIESFTLSEYLPGRDFSVQYVCRDGEIIRAKMHERLSYLGAGGLSTVSSMAALAKVIFEQRVYDVSSKAIRALDPQMSGVLFVDLKENAAGVPCVTEINAGRFVSVALAHDLADDDNASAAFVRAALGRPVKPRKPAQPTEDCYVQRDIDTLPSVVRAHELMAGIRDARDESRVFSTLLRGRAYG